MSAASRAAVAILAVLALGCDPARRVSPQGKVCSEADPCPAGWDCLQGACQPAGTCGAGTHKCPDNSCAVDDDATRCGDGCVACADTRAGRAACVGGQCGAQCGVTGAGCAVPTGVCLADAGACVQCEADTDCPQGTLPRCEVARHVCQACRTDIDCEGLGLPPHCDGPTGACVACLEDAHCPLGEVCQADTCVPGCSAARGCPVVAGATVDCFIDAQCHVSGCSLGLADCNGDYRDGCEVSIDGNVGNCGGCGRVCSTSNASGTACVGGLCRATCTGAFLDCGQPAAPTQDDGCETDSSHNLSSCGACGRACGSNNVAAPLCAGGACLSSCLSGYSNCSQPAAPAADDGCETATSASLVTDCGGCGRACSSAHATTLSCIGGLCTSTCAAGFGNCSQPASPLADDGCESNLGNTPASCGACGRACALTHVATLSCAGGACNSSCVAGFANCAQPQAPAVDDGCETDTNNDINNCGGCGTVCSTLNGTPSCVAGQCSWVCSPNFGHCAAGNTGCETDLRTSTTHCGQCGRGCGLANVSAATCSNSVCTSACTSGFGNCNQPTAPVADDGCEANLNTDTAHCGHCARPCSTTGVAAAGLACAAGVCTSSCSAGVGNCVTPAAPGADDGCETSTNTSAGNCGQCGRACATGGNVFFATCGAGVCTSSCNPGWGNCSAPAAPTADDGCETSTDTSTANCGACGRGCNTANTATLSCAAGLCASTCSGTAGNCSQPVAPAADDGCEANLSTDLNHCGSCARGCVDGGFVATPACAAGVCSSLCVAGRGNCSQPAAPTPDNGCETDTTSDATHCGTCALACGALPHTAAVCAASACDAGPCVAGWGNCDGLASNGCEANLGTDVNHCGACTRLCSASFVVTRSCAGGACNSTCVAGRGNCAQPPTPLTAPLVADDGCETNTTNDSMNCSACGGVCSTPPNVMDAGCTNSVCGVGSCQPGNVNCNGFSVDGCECGGSVCCPGPSCSSYHDGGVNWPDGGRFAYDTCSSPNTSRQLHACQQYYGVGNCFTGGNSVNPNPCPHVSTPIWACGLQPDGGCSGPTPVYCWATDFSAAGTQDFLPAGVWRATAVNVGCVPTTLTCVGPWD